MVVMLNFVEGIKNPIGIKCGPTLKDSELIKLCNILNPKNEPGRITLNIKIWSR